MFDSKRPRRRPAAALLRQAGSGPAAAEPARIHCHVAGAVACVVAPGAAAAEPPRPHYQVAAPAAPVAVSSAEVAAAASPGAAASAFCDPWLPWRWWRGRVAAPRKEGGGDRVAAPRQEGAERRPQGARRNGKQRPPESLPPPFLPSPRWCGVWVGGRACETPAPLRGLYIYINIGGLASPRSSVRTSIRA